MKKCSYKNEDLTNVESQEKSQVVGKGFVRVSRSLFVSIVNNVEIFRLKKLILILTVNHFSSVVSIARDIFNCPQILENGKQTWSLQLTIPLEFTVLWQYFQNNRIKRNFISNFPRNYSYNKSFITKTKRKLKPNLLRCGDVEANPGPAEVNVSNNNSGKIGKVITYNTRGIKEYYKIKRIFNSCAKLMLLNPLAIFNLQETHLDRQDINRIQNLWRGGFNLSPGTNKSRGCITLWGSAWTEVEKWADTQGRICVSTLRCSCVTISIVNIYAPNDPSCNFFDEVFSKIVDIKDKYDSLVFLVGDFNLVINSTTDSVNRNQGTQERLVSTLVKENTKALQMFDSYRSIHPTDGFTWNRGKCYSRLDMVFASDIIENKVVSASTDWAFDNSDHAMVDITFSLPNSRRKGPGLPRIDATILGDEHIRVEVENRLVDLIQQAPITWNPEQRWEYIKMSIRSIMWEISARIKKVENVEIEAIKSQLNMLQNTKARLSADGKLGSRLESQIDNDILEFDKTLDEYRIKRSKALAFKAKSKWFNEGEKSNKYFLNLIKKRSAENEIISLNDGEKSAHNQKDIEELIRNFYENLYAEDKKLNQNYNDFFPECPKLNETQRIEMDKEITLDELEVTIGSCDDSAPGPDGIMYSVYKKLWRILGKHLLECWKYSKSTGILPLSQRNSSITLLPKEGKDLSQIANWRPITLTNCDLKIFTKCYATRMSSVLDKLIHPSQTAYIPGRSVHDNLRMFEFYKNYCNRYNVDAILMSLDAKKAFDSVDHRYMFATLRKYGFSENFIEVVKLLYNDIKADILVNGYKTCMIRICRCVKQGDALSCALFILCIDPLIRRIEANKEIESMNIQTPLSNRKINTKCGGFADDVGVVIKNRIRSIEGIFKEYEIFSAFSGIQINETKTEIMPLLKSKKLETVHTRCYGRTVNLKMVNSIKICGITFSNDENLTYRDNVTNKIDNLKAKMLAWQFRALTISGKIQVCKTFGISQLIYSMQICDFKDNDLNDVERFMFNFIWSKNVAQKIAPDRIKREIMKLDYDKGGLKVPDVRDMNSALKLKQFLRATEANHVIKVIQKWELESLDYDYEVQQEYDRIVSIDIVTSVAQRTINSLTDKMREEVDLHDSSQCVYDLIASTDVKEYLKRKKRVLALTFYGPLFNCGIETFKQLHTESNFPRNDRFEILSKNVIGNFPKPWINIIEMNECDSAIDIRQNIPIAHNKVTLAKVITVKAVRNRLLKCEIKPFAFESKLNIPKDSDINPFVINRLANKSEHLRMIKYRFLHCDIFCKQRMFKFKMCDNDKCDYCGNVESIKHLMWDCGRARNVWGCANRILSLCGIQQVTNYNNLFTGVNPTNLVLEAMITKVTQLIIQIDRSNDISEQKLKSEIIFLGKMHRKNVQQNIWNVLIEVCSNI
jgi:exonuclease III